MKAWCGVRMKSVGRGRCGPGGFIEPEAIDCAHAWVSREGPGRLEAIRLWKIAPSAAIRVAIPIGRNVLLMPEAIPARLGSATLTAVEASGALTMPIPIPPTTKPATRAV